MSEVGDAVQVVMLCGRGAMLIGNISLKLAMQVVKLMNTIYLAKWEGSVSLNRLRQIKGDDFVFINVSSEQKADLAAIEKEMKSHGILYARMPDLCGGDARTQYAIASSDAVKMRAMLLDHTAGPNSHIRVGPISEADYMMTGKKADGTDTKEMEALKKSAQETVDAAKKAPQKSEAAWEANDRDKKEQSAKTKNRKKTKAEKVNTAPERGMVRAAIKDVPSEQAPENIIFTKHPTRPDASVEKVLQNTISDVRIRSQEYQRQYGTDSVLWIKQKPMYENRQYAQFLMPDGKNSIFIRQTDILPGRDAQTGVRLAAVFTDQRYSMMNMEKVNVVAADGTKAIAMFKLPGGAVIAHGNQQPDKKKGGPELAKGTQKKEQTTGNKTVRSPEKTKSR